MPGFSESAPPVSFSVREWEVVGRWERRRVAFQAIFKETRRPSKDMQMTIAAQLGLDPTTVANFFMNARRRGAERWKDECERKGRQDLAQGHQPSPHHYVSETHHPPPHLHMDVLDLETLHPPPPFPPPNDPHLH